MEQLVQRVILRLSQEDYDKLKEIAYEEQTTISKLVREMIRDAIW